MTDRTAYWRNYAWRRRLLAPLRAEHLDERVSRWLRKRRMRRLDGALKALT